MNPKKEEDLFLISQAAVDKIDSLIGTLNLAVSEILEARPVRDHRPYFTGHQERYDEEIGEVIYKGNLTDHF